MKYTPQLALAALTWGLSTLLHAAEPKPDYQSMRLPYSQRLQLWLKLVDGERVDEGLALGESVLAEASLPNARVWLAGRLSIEYSVARDWARAKTLLDDAQQIVESRAFRWSADSGESGHWKHNALSMYHQGQCVWLARTSRHAESLTSCQQAVDSAAKMRETVRFTSRPPAEADEDYAVVRLRQFSADWAAGRQQAAQRALTEVVAQEREGRLNPLSSAYLYRLVAGMMSDLNDEERALAWAHRSLEVSERLGASPSHSLVLRSRLTLAHVLVRARRWTEAIAEFDAIDAGTKTSPRMHAAMLSLDARGLAFAHNNRLPELTAQLGRSLRFWQTELGQQHGVSARLQGLWAISQLKGPVVKHAEAAIQLRRAVRLILDAEDLRSEGARLFEDQLVHYILEQYLLLLQKDGRAMSREDSALAFELADYLRRSGVQGAIQDAAVRSAVQSAGLGDLVRQDQDARRELGVLHDFVASQIATRDAARVDVAVQKMKARITELEATRTDLRQRIALGFPDYDRLIRPRSPVPSDVAALLVDGEVFVSMLPTERGVHLWAVSVNGETLHRFSPIPAPELKRAANALRVSTDFDGGPLPAFAESEAQRLYTALIGPLESALGGARHVVIAASGELSRLPFAALISGPRAESVVAAPQWLARRFALSQVPSATGWLATRALDKTTRSPEPLLAWGDPAFKLGATNPASAATTRRLISMRSNAAAALDRGVEPNWPRYADFPALPETRDELLAIATTLKAETGRALRLGNAATRASVLAASKSGELARKRVVVFATHGLMAGDLPHLDQPALAMAATADSEKDPLSALLKLDDVLGLKLNADWVVLSACNTAAADGKVQEALSGLARGFFYAGARSLLVTQWAVETETAKLLTTHTFEHYATHPQAGKAESLRQAMLRVMADPRYTHPAFWAPYVLVGDGAR